MTRAAARSGGDGARPPVAAPRGFFLDPRARFYSAHGKQFCPIINRAIVGGWLYARGAFHTSECNGNQIERRRARGPSAGVNHPVNTKDPSRTYAERGDSRRAEKSSTIARGHPCVRRSPLTLVHVNEEVRAPVPAFPPLRGPRFLPSSRLAALVAPARLPFFFSLLSLSVSLSRGVTCRT